MPVYPGALTSPALPHPHGARPLVDLRYGVAPFFLPPPLPRQCIDGVLRIEGILLHPLRECPVVAWGLLWVSRAYERVRASGVRRAAMRGRAGSGDAKGAWLRSVPSGGRTVANPETMPPRTAAVEVLVGTCEDSGC